MNINIYNGYIFLTAFVISVTFSACHFMKSKPGYVCDTEFNPNARIEYSIIDTLDHDVNQSIIMGTISNNQENVATALIRIPKLNIETKSNIDGKFYLQIPENTILEKENLEFTVEYIGYKTLKVNLNHIINKEIGILLVD